MRKSPKRKKTIRKSKARRKSKRKVRKSKVRRKAKRKPRKSKGNRKPRRKSKRKPRKSKGNRKPRRKSSKGKSIIISLIPLLTRRRLTTSSKNYSDQNIWSVILWNRPNYWETSVEEVLNIIGQFTPIDLIFLQEVKRDRRKILTLQMRTKSQYNKPISTIYEGMFTKHFLNYEYKMVCAYGQEEKDTSLGSRLYSNELCQISLVEKRNNILESATIDLNDYWIGLGKTGRYIRLVLGVKIEKNGREIWWWNLHFPHSHIEQLTNELIRRIDKDYGDSKHVILGDFNKDPDPEFKISGWSFHYTKDLATQSKHSINCGITPQVKGSASIYDYMLTNITDANINVEHAGKNYSLRSDHCPLKITLDFS